MDVTVLLLMRNPNQLELETLELVRSQRVERRVVVHVIDSSSDIDTDTIRRVRDMSDRWDHIEPTSFSHGPTRNLGIDHVDTPLFVSLSSDAHPITDRWLEALVKPLVEDAADASYGGQRSRDADPEREATYGYLYPDHAEIKTSSDVGRLGVRAFHFSDVSSAFKTEVIREIRYPDVTIFQDVGVAKRLLDSGYRIAYVPEASVYHAHPMGWKSMWARYRGLGEVWERNGIFKEIKREHHGGLARAGFEAVRSMVPRFGAGPRAAVRSIAVGFVKAAAVTQGRRDARRRPPLGLEWDPEEGSRAVRRAGR